MKFSESAPAVAYAARLGAREYLAENPPGVLLGAVASRAVLQAVFLTVLGLAAGGPTGALTAGLGASAFGVVAATVIKAPDVLIGERIYGTLFRLRMTEVPLLGVLLARWLVYAAEGFASAVVAVPAVAAVTGRWQLLWELPALLPVYALMTMTCSGFGLAIAVVAVNRRSDVFLTNLASYLLLAFIGVLAPLSGNGVLSTVGALLPLTHGAAALRSMAMSDGSAAPQLLAEVLVGAAWWALATVGLKIQTARSRRLGTDFLM